MKRNKKSNIIKFEPASWVKSYVDGLTCIGRTIINPDGKEIIVLLNSICGCTCLEWNHFCKVATNITKLRFVTNENDAKVLNNLKRYTEQQRLLEFALNFGSKGAEA